MHKRLRPQVSRLYQRIRYTHPTWQCATFLELHRSGFPHYHALVRSNYVPIHEVRALWHKLTGNFIVDMRLIRDPNVAMKYVTKYVTKQVENPALAEMGPKVTFTRGFLLRDKSDSQNSELIWEREKRHPHEVADRLKPYYDIVYQDRTVTATIKSAKPHVCTVLRPFEDPTEQEVDPWASETAPNASNAS